MNSIDQSQIFFLISSIGFVVLWSLVGTALVYVLKILKVFEKILNKINDDIDSFGETTKEMLEELRESLAYKLITYKKIKKNNK